jgi:hypothetical protein
MKRMKVKIIVVACILITPLAIAQTNVSQSGSKRSSKGNTTQSTATPAGRVMMVNSFIPGSKIAVSATPNSRRMTYVLSKDVQYVDSAGKKIDPSLIRTGTHVRLESTGGERATVNRVVLIQPE